MKMNQTIPEASVKLCRQSIVRSWSVALMVSASLFATASSANPDSPVVVAGSASFEQMGNALNVTNAPGTIINWQGFSINRNELTRFLQQGPQSAVLNRVTGTGISNILGELLSNGRVFLVNPNGIVIGNGARIDTAGFVASTLNITDDDFLGGQYRFKGDGGSIQNNGTITAGPHGEVILIAPTLENSGAISVTDGEIILAAGREVTLTSLDDANISFRVSAPSDKVINIGNLTANNGAIGVFANQITSSGELSANRVTTNSRGQIVLEADGSNQVSGTISATGSDVPGGEIQILGDSIALDSAQLDVSGTNGGRVLVGGEFQGRGNLPRANRTTIDASSVIHADALENGNGGEVIVWSEQATDSQGRLTARGGMVSGDGGLVETSSRGSLSFGQPADVSAANGAAGTWLLDPEDIVIDSGYADSISSALNGGSNVQVKTADSGTGQGNITVSAPIRKTEGPDAALGLIAHNRIDVNAPIESTSGKLDVSLRAGRDIAVNASILTNGGSYSANIVPSLLPSEPEIEDESGVETESEVEPEPDQNLVGSADTPQADSGSPSTADNATANNIALNDNGISIQGDIDTAGGDVEIDAGDSGLLGISGAVSTGGEIAGNIQLTGDQVALYDTASIDASGSSGGGQILIGGDQQGLNPDNANSNAVYVAESATVSANGLDHGNGGRVIVYSDNVANIYGSLAARGGSESGDGGFIETSGKNYLSVTRAADASASNGQSGQWLIDPSSIDITDDTSNTSIDQSAGPDGVNFTTSPGSATSTLSTIELGIALTNGTDVTVETNGDNPGEGNINFLGELDLGTFSSQVPSGALTLRAHNDVNIRNSIIGGRQTRLAELTLIANSDGLDGGDVNIDAAGVGGRLTVETRGDINISAENLTIRGGDNDAEEDVRLNPDGGFQFDIEDTIDIISNDRDSEVTLFARSREAGASSISADNLLLRTVGTGRSEIIFQFPFPQVVVADINITDELTLQGGLFRGSANISANHFNWDAGTISAGAGGFNILQSATLDFNSGNVPVGGFGGSTLFGNLNVAAGATVDWDSGSLALIGDINNAGQFNANDDGGMFGVFDVGAGNFNNLEGGVFTKAGSNCTPDCGSTSFGSPFNSFDLVSFINEGTVVIEQGNLAFTAAPSDTSSTAFSGGYRQSGPNSATILAGGNLNVFQPFSGNSQPGPGDIPDPSRVAFEGGIIRGGTGDITSEGGSITGDATLTNTTIAAGFSPGTLTFNNDLTLDNTSSFDIELASTAPGDFDLTNVNGTATLNNPSVNVTFDGYMPPDTAGVVDSFDIIQANVLTIAPNTGQLPVNQPADLGAGVDAFSGQQGAGTYFLAYGSSGGDGTPVTPDPITPTTPGVPVIPGDTDQPPVLVLTAPVPFIPDSGIIPRSGNLPVPAEPMGTVNFDPVSSVITLAGQTPQLEEINDSPEFLQCY